MPRTTISQRLTSLPALLAVASLVLLAGAIPSQAATRATPDRFVTTELPDSKVGRQVQWFVEASTRLPISDAELRAHLTKTFLTSPGGSPKEINELLRTVIDAGGVRLLGLLVVERNALVAIVTGRNGQELVLTLSVNPAGLIEFATIQPAAAGPEVALPAPSGTAAVGTDVAQLIDRARGDRRLMLTRWYPAASTSRNRPRATYASPRLSAVLGLPPVRANARIGAAPRRGSLPVVLFSPGFGTPRVIYQALAEDLASHGYLVIAVDHTGEAPVEFPDGGIRLPAAPTENPIAAASTTRLIDLRLILRRLSTMRKGPLPDRRRIAAVGHSLGGSTAAALLRVDPRVRAGVNLDGTIFGAASRLGVRRPFLALTGAGHWADDADLRRLFGRSRGARLAFEIAGFDHFSFSDLPVITPRGEGVGRQPSARDISLQRAYVRAFLDRYVRHRSAPLLDSRSRRSPRVSVTYRGR